MRFFVINATVIVVIQVWILHNIKVTTQNRSIIIQSFYMSNNGSEEFWAIFIWTIEKDERESIVIYA